MSDWTFFDLSSFPPPEAIEELDFEALFGIAKADMIARMPEIAPIIALESEPATKLLQVHAYVEMLVRARINDAIRANLLAYATGSDLDHLAVFYDVIRLVGESDDAFRRRVILAIQGRSTGGTVPRYRSVALGASVRVADAVVYRIGNDPTVYVAVYATDNDGVADASLLAQVEAALNDPAVRMVNDTIVVQSAVFEVVNLEANVWLLPEAPNALLEVLPDTLRASWGAETGLGFDLTRAWLTARLMVPGIQRVEIVTPWADVIAPPERAISLGAIVLNNMGRDY
ncbi:baseplate J/gp47 family protein [Chelatococcus sp. XZ-Ab1]|uniref:baseplate assembly protein n=1 Tax=Chelatococcus sp. XZ-Ab1 TaxID=3034027 RepID=UPI0023E428A0|nr:baseplate J/gp47 family protein [Chelatococcus sp. XZ-Ab1]